MGIVLMKSGASSPMGHNSSVKTIKLTPNTKPNNVAALKITSSAYTGTDAISSTTPTRSKTREWTSFRSMIHLIFRWKLSEGPRRYHQDC